MDQSLSYWFLICIQFDRTTPKSFLQFLLKTEIGKIDQGDFFKMSWKDCLFDPDALETLRNSAIKILKVKLYLY